MDEINSVLKELD